MSDIETITKKFENYAEERLSVGDISDAAKALASQSVEINSLTKALAAKDAEIERLRGALNPFAFLDEDKKNGGTVQEAWEIMYKDRFQDWVDFNDIANARAAINPETSS